MSSQTKPVIVIFGAGPGLGTSVARRFGREGFRVALVGRSRPRLEALVATLAAEGIESAPFTADLSDPTQVSALLADVRARFGRIDGIEYGPASAADQNFVPAGALDTADLERYLRTFLLTPIEVIRGVLLEFTERGSGTILVTHGSSAANAMPFLSGVGPAMAGMRNYLYSLAGELAGTGVYAGTLTIGALIVSGDQEADQGFPGDEKAGFSFPTVHPDVLADLYWDMHVERSQTERTYPL